MTTNFFTSRRPQTIYKTFKSTATTADKPQPVGAAHVSVMTSDGDTSSQNVTGRLVRSANRGGNPPTGPPRAAGTTRPVGGLDWPPRGQPAGVGVRCYSDPVDRPKCLL